MEYLDLKQGSDEWLAIKAGKFSASRAAALMAKGRGNQPSVTRANLIADIAAERLTGRYTEGFKSAAMERGNELEQEAREAYEFDRGVCVKTVGFIDHPSIAFCGCSPDGLLGDDGMVELKVQNAARHIKSLTSGAHAVEYRLQGQFQLFVTGRQWVEFVSYNPDFPPHLHLAITRAERNNEMIASFAGEIARAESEVQAIIKELGALRERNES